jgi:hypothetical protein
MPTNRHRLDSLREGNRWRKLWVLCMMASFPYCHWQVQAWGGVRRVLHVSPYDCQSTIPSCFRPSCHTLQQSSTVLYSLDAPLDATPDWDVWTTTTTSANSKTPDYGWDEMEDDSPTDSSATTITTIPEGAFTVTDTTAVQVIDTTLFPHRPLGCTVEESLVPVSLCSLQSILSLHTPSPESLPLPSPTAVAAYSPVLLITKVNPESHAARAGFQVGDVVLGWSSVFGTELDSVWGYSLEQL